MYVIAFKVSRPRLIPLYLVLHVCINKTNNILSFNNTNKRDVQMEGQAVFLQRN